jgi:putative OPT family oligopeptide transporter
MNKNHTRDMAELTLRGMLLGAVMTVIFTASNIYLGLKVGLTFSSAIPAAVISMVVLRFLGGGNILENNMVQTQASAAGTLSAVIFILPGLVMMGHWQGFPFWQTAGICAAGGVLGVIFTIPLRRVMVVESDLPYPEGVAAAEILRAGSANAQEARKGLQDIMAGGVMAALFSFVANGLRIFSDSFNLWLTAGASVFRLSTSFSFALLGAGYLIGITAGVATLLGVIIAWGIVIPVLTATTPMPADTTIMAFATGLWTSQVRFMGAGLLGIASIWTLATLFMPIMRGIRQALGAVKDKRGSHALPATEQDLSPLTMIGVTLLAIVGLAVVFALFLFDAPLTLRLFLGLIAYGVVFACVFGFLVAAACGYMAGLVGSSSSPISGIGIVAVMLISLLLLASGMMDTLLATPEGSKLAISIALFVTAAVIAIAAIANDNLQDLKAGWLLGATPWKQQVALLLGCCVGAMVIPPVLGFLYHGYGFSGAMPREGMDVSQALAAPQATLMTAITNGIFTRQLNWLMILLGIGLGAVLIGVDALLKKTTKHAQLPVLAVGLGIYLPPVVSMALVIGALFAWGIERILRRRADAAGQDTATYNAAAHRRGVLIASGLIVGESLVGVLLAAIIGVSGADAPLAIGHPDAWYAQWLGVFVFALVLMRIAQRILARDARS